MLHLKPVFWRILVTALALSTLLGLAKVSARVPLTTAPTEVQAPAAESTGVEVRGTARPGDAVRLTQGETLIGQVNAGADGNWRITIPEMASKTVPLHVQVIPTDQRGAVPDQEPVSILVSVIVGTNRVDVRVQVTSPNGQVDIEVTVPFEPAPCTEGTGLGLAAAAPASVATQQPAAQPPSSPTSQPALQSPAQPAQATYHTVTRGETLAIIGARYGVSAQAIMKANRIRNPNLIRVGQRLLIPTR